MNDLGQFLIQFPSSYTKLRLFLKQKLFGFYEDKQKP